METRGAGEQQAVLSLRAWRESQPGRARGGGRWASSSTGRCCPKKEQPGDPPSLRSSIQMQGRAGLEPDPRARTGATRAVHSPLPISSLSRATGQPCSCPSESKQRRLPAAGRLPAAARRLRVGSPGARMEADWFFNAHLVRSFPFGGIRSFAQGFHIPPVFPNALGALCPWAWLLSPMLLPLNGIVKNQVR